MQQRPIAILVDALRRLGAAIEYAGNEGFPPLDITGRRLAGGALEVKGSISSQYLSALLLIAPALERGLTLRLTGEIISRPYIDLTLQVMRAFGAQAEWTAADCIEVAPVRYLDRPFQVENDWSAASYWYEMVALSPASRITIPYLYRNSSQGDSRVSELFDRLGVVTTYEKEGITLTGKESDARLMEADLIEAPDLAQTLVVTCALKNIPFRFSGLQSLKIKETDRIRALIKELGKLGYPLEEKNSTLSWDGSRTKPEEAPAIDTYEDHRMAMAFAPASLLFEGLIINDPQVVSKSYPRFWEDLERTGFKITKTD
jgi:3-phosphoshikimate 1-carboxyvinyltransferase